jgi:hypothetical protein
MACFKWHVRRHGPGYRLAEGRARHRSGEATRAAPEGDNWYKMVCWLDFSLVGDLFCP